MFTLEFAQRQGVIKDQFVDSNGQRSEKVVFIPPPPADSDGAWVKPVAETIQAAITGTAQVLTARERRRAGRDGISPITSGDYALLPGSVPSSQVQSGVPMWVWGAGAIGLGALAFVGIVKKKPKKK